MERVEAAPHAAASLTLYALAHTLHREAAGGLFRLVKLRDLDEEARRLAYALMEAMARGENRDPAWEQTLARLDELVRRG